MNPILIDCEGSGEQQEKKHQLELLYKDGYWNYRVICPYETLGKDRPCAVWIDGYDGDGIEHTDTMDECYYEQIADDAGADVIHGSFNIKINIDKTFGGDDGYMEIDGNYFDCTTSP